MEFLKKRKVKLVVLALAFLIVIVGGSYAWFNTKVENEQIITQGNLRLTGSFEDVEDSLYEPGLTVECNGTITSTGNLPVMVKVEGRTDIKRIYEDADYTPIDNPTFVEDNMASYTISPTSGSYNASIEDGIYWFYNINEPTEVYFMMDPGSSIGVTLVATLSGEMGNEYQDSEVKLIGLYRGTQVLDGALEAEFGITGDSLEALNDASSRGRSQSIGKQKLMELLNRGA